MGLLSEGLSFGNFIHSAVMQRLHSAGLVFWKIHTLCSHLSDHFAGIIFLENSYNVQTRHITPS